MSIELWLVIYLMGAAAAYLFLKYFVRRINRPKATVDLPIYSKRDKVFCILMSSLSWLAFALVLIVAIMQIFVRLFDDNTEAKW